MKENRFDFYDTYKPHSRSLNSIEARWLMFGRLLVTQDIEEYKALYRELTTFRRCNEYNRDKRYKRLDRTHKVILESFGGMNDR